MTMLPASALALHDGTVRTLLPNGLTVLIKRDVTAPVVAVVTHVKAGYFDESDDIVGIAHVLEHMYFKGTPTRGVGEIARQTKANGGYLNAHTIYDHTSYFTVLPSASFTEGLDIQFDAYARSSLDAGELARELEVIIQEEKRKRDSPGAVTIEGLYALMHDHHRIRRWRIGEETALRAFTRTQLDAFYRTWYQPSNTILAIVGDVEIDHVLREVERRYGTLRNAPITRVAAPLEIDASGFRFRDFSGDIAQQQIAFGWRVPPLSHPDSPALDVAAIALGSGRASRLYRAVRDRRRASSVSAFNYTAGDLGVFVVHADAPPAQAREAAYAMWHEVNAARAGGFAAHEVVRAQRIAEARWLRRLETMEGQANYLAAWEADGGLSAARAYYERLLSVDAADAQRALRTHLDPEQASVLSYRPRDAMPLSESATTFRAELRACEEDATAATAAVDASPVSPATAAEPAHAPGHAIPQGVTNGVHVYATSMGVAVLIAPRADAPIANVGVFQRGGSVLDPIGQEGLARLTAQTMLKGTLRQSGAAIAEAAESLGSSIGVTAGLETLGWSMSVPTAYLDRAVSLLADVVQHPTFPEPALETEVALARADIRRAHDDMYRWPLRLATMAAYGDHAYARATIGTGDSVSALGVADLQRFHSQHVLTADAVIVVVGDVQPDATANQVARAFCELTHRAALPVSAPQWPLQPEVHEESRDKKQSAIALLFPGPSRRDGQRIVAQVLSSVVSGLGGRFFDELRDRQSLAYTVAAYPVERSASGVFAAYIATSPEREAEALAGLLSEFARLREVRITDEDLNRAQRYLIGTHAIARQSGASLLGDIVDAWLFGDGLQELTAQDALVKAVSVDDMLTLARTCFGDGVPTQGIVHGRAASR